MQHTDIYAEALTSHFLISRAAQETQERFSELPVCVDSGPSVHALMLERVSIFPFPLQLHVSPDRRGFIKSRFAEES